MSCLNISFITLAITLLGFWLIVSGSFDIQHLVAGSIVSTLISCYSITIFNYKLKIFNITKILLFVKFIIALIIEITKANVYVARIVLHPALPISPGFVRIKTGLKSEFLIAILANSISLTPGTLSVDVDKDEILVHLLTAESGKNLNKWIILRILKKLEVT